MASYYNRPIYNMRLPGHHRLQSVQAEPVLDMPASLQEGDDRPRRGSITTSSPAQLQDREDSEDSATTLAGPPISTPTEPSTTTSAPSPAPVSISVQVPPPAYTGNGLPLVRTTSSGRTLVPAPGSAGGRRSRAVKIAWAYHPAISGHWWYIYLFRLFRFLAIQKESLIGDLPNELEEILDTSGIDLREQQKMNELFSARISHLNNWVLPDLASTRLWLSIVEIGGLAILIFFIVALVVTGATQTGLLEAAEVALIVGIVFAAGLVNQTRLRRWRLQAQLRALSREWSPLPTSIASISSTLPQLFATRTFTSNMSGRDIERRAQAISMNRAMDEEGLKPIMRWSMVQREGGFWTAWRPIINVELIVPPGAGVSDRRASVTQTASREQRRPPPIAEDYVPTYTPRETPGERTVQFSR